MAATSSQEEKKEKKNNVDGLTDAYASVQWPKGEIWPKFVATNHASKTLEVLIFQDDIPKKVADFRPCLTVPFNVEDPTFVVMKDRNKEKADLKTVYRGIPPFFIYAPPFWLLLKSVPYEDQRGNPYKDSFYDNPSPSEGVQSSIRVLEDYFHIWVYYQNSVLGKQPNETPSDYELRMERYGRYKTSLQILVSSDLDAARQALIYNVENGKQFAVLRERAKNNNFKYNKKFASGEIVMHVYDLLFSYTMNVIRVYEQGLMKAFGFTANQIKFFKARTVTPLLSHTTYQKLDLLVKDEIWLAANVNDVQQMAMEVDGKFYDPYHFIANLPPANEINGTTFAERIQKLNVSYTNKGRYVSGNSIRILFETFIALLPREGSLKLGEELFKATTAPENDETKLADDIKSDDMVDDDDLF